MSSEIVVRKCETMEEFQQCRELELKVWGEDHREAQPLINFVVALHTGGQALGAFDGDKMVGVTLAFPALGPNNTSHLHSHITGVDEKYRDRGVGRMLKLFQREEALSRGLKLIQWTFDPLQMRNAHFNLNRLGAIARHYYPNIYGVTTSPLDQGLPTDRLMAEWHLDSPRVIAAIAGDSDGAEESTATIALPGELEQWKREDPKKVIEVQERIREEFQNWFTQGYVAAAVRRTAKGHSYALRPWALAGCKSAVPSSA